MGCPHFYEWEDCPKCSPKPSELKRAKTIVDLDSLEPDQAIRRLLGAAAEIARGEGLGTREFGEMARKAFKDLKKHLEVKDEDP